jgi:hypothetical protein
MNLPMNPTRRLAMWTSALLLAACAAPMPSDDARESPTLDMQSYFNGDVIAHGIFTDRAGKVVKRFSVDLRCRWEHDDGVLDETFHFSDGTTQKRVWHVQRLADVDGERRDAGRADDIVGSASGAAAGNALHWTYALRLPVDGRETEAQFDDWMFLVSPGVLLNRAVMSKFGVRLGEVTLSFQRS